MANKKMTRYELMEKVVQWANGTDDTALIEAANAALAAEAKKRERKTAGGGDTAEKRKTRSRITQMLTAMVANGNDPVGTDWVCRHVDGVDTSHKVAGLTRRTNKLGITAYGDTVKGKRTWYVTDYGVSVLQDGSLDTVLMGE